MCRARRLLLTFNASPNLVDDINKQSALHWAAVSGNLLAIEQLHEAHADCTLKNAKVCHQSSHSTFISNSNSTWSASFLLASAA